MHNIRHYISIVEGVVSEATGVPHWKHDPERTAYVVYDAEGKEVEVFKYKDRFNLSKEYNAALKKVGELKRAAMDLEKKKQEDAPLTSHELEYIEKHRKWKHFFDKLKKVDDDTREIYEEFMNKLMSRMQALQKTRLIRDKVILNTEKFYDQVKEEK